MPFYFEANNVQSTILMGDLEMSRKGSWYGDFEIETGIIPINGTPAKITIYDQQLIGRCLTGGNWNNKASVRVTGGIGKDSAGNLIPWDTISQNGSLSKQLPSKDYQQQPLRIPITDALRAASLTLTEIPGVDLTTRLTTWVRMSGPISSALELLLKPLNFYYRTLDDGSIGIFDNGMTYARPIYIQDQDYQLMDVDTIKVIYTIAVNTKMITFTNSFIATDADVIHHKIDSSQLRTRVTLRP